MRPTPAPTAPTVPNALRLLGVIPLSLLGLVSLAYTLPWLINALEKWGLPQAELVAFPSLIGWVIGWSYGGALLACAAAGVLARDRVAQGFLVAGGLGAVLIGFLLMRTTLTLGALMSVLAGGLAVAAGLVGLVVAEVTARKRRSPRQDW